MEVTIRYISKKLKSEFHHYMSKENAYMLAHHNIIKLHEPRDVVSLFKREVYGYYTECNFCKVVYLAWYLNLFVDMMAVSLGLVLWHSVDRINESNILSTKEKERRAVFHCLGLFTLACVGVFFLFLETLSYPIVIGCIYATLNNMATVSLCPEYYTLGHIFYRNKPPFYGHVIKSNHFFLKPLITGFYGSQCLTKWIGLLLFVLHQTGLVLFNRPTHFETCLFVALGLLCSHCVAKYSELQIDRLFEEYRITSNENHKVNLDPLLMNETWSSVHPRGCNAALDKLAKSIDEFILNDEVPLRLVKPWYSNSMRNYSGYIWGIVGLFLIISRNFILSLFA